MAAQEIAKSAVISECGRYRYRLYRSWAEKTSSLPAHGIFLRMANSQQSSMKSIAVCGLGRCGSSLMMQMLQAAGVECIGRFPAFEESAYYREGVSRRLLELDGKGKAVKLLDPHRFSVVFHSLTCMQVIWMRRQFHHQAKSQVKMLRLLGGTLMPIGKTTCTRMKHRLQEDHYRCMDQFRIHGIKPLMLHYEELLRNPLKIAETVQEFLQRPLDLCAMVAAVRKNDPRCAADLQMEEWLVEMSQ